MNKFSLLLSATVLGYLVMILPYSGCSPESVSGGGTEGGNTVYGVIVNGDKSALGNTRVRLLPSDYNPGISDLNASTLTTITDDDGNYVFDHAIEGEYVIEAKDIESGKRALITDIIVTEEDIQVPVGTLREPGTIMIALPEKVRTSAEYVYVPGTTIYAYIDDASDFVVVDSVPATRLSSICSARQSDSTLNVLRYDIHVTPEDTAVVTHTQWKYARRFYLNTTTTGAGVKGVVTAFPIVIRLTEDNYGFCEAKTDGNDVCFFRADSVPLVHEIERWDAAAKQAEIWLRVDTIYGNDSTQFIMMYSSNSDPVDNLKDMAVFDTAAGFQGVWHLGENADIVYDATPNCFHGLRNGTMVASPGIVGFGQQFGDSGALIDMGNVLNTERSDLTISAWVKRSKTGLQTIMAKSDGGSPNSDYGWTLSFHSADQLHFFAASGGTSWGTYGAFDCWSKEESPVDDTTEWHFVVAIFDRSDKGECRLYIDGVAMSGGSNGNIAGVSSLVNEASFRIGAEADGEYTWTGLIDECIVAHTIRDEVWIRLCYSNQGTNDRLIQYDY